MKIVLESEQFTEGKNYVLGLDVGISSVGWGLLELDEFGNPYKILDVGSRIFTPGEVEKTGIVVQKKEEKSSRKNMQSKTGL